MVWELGLSVARGWGEVPDVRRKLVLGYRDRFAFGSEKKIEYVLNRRSGFPTVPR